MKYMDSNILLSWKNCLQPEFLCGPSCLVAVHYIMSNKTEIQKQNEFQYFVNDLTNNFQSILHGADDLRNTFKLNEIFNMTLSLKMNVQKINFKLNYVKII